MNEQSPIRDNFDRIIGDLTGLPDHRMSKASTVTTVLPILGNAQSYIVRTCRMPDNQFVGFIEMVEATGHIRIVVPEKAMAALYRQRESLITQVRKASAKARYAAEHPEWSPKRKERKLRRKTKKKGA